VPTSIKHSSSTLRSAVIGAGPISEAHLKYLSAAPGIDLAGVCDLSPSMAQYAVMRFGVARAFTDATQMLREVKPDVVHILTPPNTHLPLASEALASGAHVIVEKPATTSNSELKELISAARAAGRWVIEDHNYRFNEPIMEIERMISEGKLGEVRDVEVRLSLNIVDSSNRFADENLPHPAHRLPAGAIHDFITHLAYLTLRFIPTYQRVAAAWRQYSGHKLFKFDDLDALILGDCAHARIRFCAQTLPESFSVVVRGSRGMAETDLFQPYLRSNVDRRVGKQLNPLANHFAGGCSLVGASASGFANKVMQKTPLEGLGTFLDRTYEALRQNTEPPVSYDDMDRTSQLVDALLDKENQI
jgi:predicted dehydrogenase